MNPIIWSKILRTIDEIEEIVAWVYHTILTKKYKIILWTVLIMRLIFPMIALAFKWISTTWSVVMIIEPVLALSIVFSAVYLEEDS